mmetsp:Transcript_20261/g.66255  ORF Transcript_20261/g.66255 Transcript_20261/m.66255 type:complete len:291 (+) Transcript_20261:1076-1948(+)
MRARGERRVLLLRAAAQERLRRGPRGREAVLPPGPRRRDDDAHLPGAAGSRVHGDLRVRHVAPVRAPLQGGGRGDVREDGLLLPRPVPPRRQVRPRGHLPPAEALEDPGARRLHALQPPGARGRQARAAAAFELRDFFSRVRPHHARPVRRRRRQRDDARQVPARLRRGAEPDARELVLDQGGAHAALEARRHGRDAARRPAGEHAPGEERGRRRGHGAADLPRPARPRDPRRRRAGGRRGAPGARRPAPARDLARGQPAGREHAPELRPPHEPVLRGVLRLPLGRGALG